MIASAPAELQAERQAKSRLDQPLLISGGKISGRRRKVDWSAYLFVLPAVLILALVYAYPIVRLVEMSFQETNVLLGTSHWTGFSNYASILSDDIIWKCARNTLVYSIGVVFGTLVISLALAFACQPFSPRLQHLMRASLYLPGVQSAVVISMIWIRLYDPQFGPINRFLGILHIPAPVWLGDPHWALCALIIMSVLSGLGVSFILLSTAINAVPRDYYEAGALDGAGSGTIFRAITLPLIRPVIVYLVIILSIGSLQAFGSIYVMTDGGPDYATATVVYQIYDEAFRYFDFGRACALAVCLTVFVMALSLIQFKLLATTVES